MCACGGRRHMWAVQAKLLVGLLGGLLLSSIRSNPCTHTHMQVPHTCMHAWALVDGFFLAATSVTTLFGPPLCLRSLASCFCKLAFAA